MKYYSQQKAFTLVETLVAIAILMVAVAGPLTIANKAYRASIDARNQTIAYNLAQEGLEYLNYEKNNDSWYKKDNTTLENNVWGPDPLQRPSVFTTCALPSYNCQVPGLPTLPAPFFRYYYLTGTKDYFQIMATVVVSWKTGTVSNSVTLQELLSNFPR